MIDLATYNQLKEDVDRLSREAERSAGRLEQLKTELEKEFGCKDIKEGRKMLMKLEKQNEAGEQEFATESKGFYEKYGELLNGS